MKKIESKGTCQTWEPEESLYVPSSQGVQDGGAPEKPGGQSLMQALLVTLATAENIPASHAMHVRLFEAPRVLEYVPAGHPTHEASSIAPTDV